MTLEERKAHVAKLKAEREAIVKEIGDLSKQRDGYIREELKHRGGPKGGFDTVVEGAITEQGEKFGIGY